MRKRLVITGGALDSLIETLLEWEALSKERDKFTNWKRSPIERENRRESIAYGNCLETVVAHLGRRAVNELMAKAKGKCRQCRHAKHQGFCGKWENTPTGRERCKCLVV